MEAKALLAVTRPVGSPKITVDETRNSAETTARYFLPKDHEKCTLIDGIVFFRMSCILPIIEVKKRLLVLHMEQNVPNLEHGIARLRFDAPVSFQPFTNNNEGYRSNNNHNNYPQDYAK